MTPSFTADILVIGAGPAGAMAAHEAARGGASVLLVEKAALPRAKVCGCCLSAAALAELAAAGLGDIPIQCGAPATRQLDLRCGGRRAVLKLPAGAVLSRAALDEALARRACDAGAVLVTQTHATVLEPGVVELRDATGARQVRAAVVIDATGLGGAKDTIESAARMGAGVVVDDASAHYAAGTIYMACGRGGYVGMVRLEDGRLDVAAAMDPPAVRKAGGPGALAAAILQQAGMPPIAALATLAWRGTPLLTRHPASVASERLLRAGDAAGYVEPFTGEGIAWALATGRAAAGLAVHAARQGDWNQDVQRQWAATHRQLVHRRMRRCRMVARLLRHPVAMSWAVGLMGMLPGVARRVAAMIQLPLGAGLGGAAAEAMATAQD